MNNLWQKEEREISEFPFIAGITFDMNFRFESHKVMVRGNLFFLLFFLLLSSAFIHLLLFSIFILYDGNDPLS